MEEEIWGERREEEEEVGLGTTCALPIQGFFFFFFLFRGWFSIFALSFKWKNPNIPLIYTGFYNTHKDFVDALLSLMNQPMNNPQDEHVYIIDRANIKAILLDMISAAFDTSIASIEWILSELLKNPRVMKNLQDELESVMGIDQMVEEKDLGKLEYLDMVVKESFRLHPVAPLLLPHESMEDITIKRYGIPKKSRTIVNTWAIRRDPKVWSENVEEFYPERFNGRNNIDIKGHDFRFLPFGSGRRGCPGMQLGLTNVKFVLAQLVQ